MEASPDDMLGVKLDLGCVFYIVWTKDLLHLDPLLSMPRCAQLTWPVMDAVLEWRDRLGVALTSLPVT